LREGANQIGLDHIKKTVNCLNAAELEIPRIRNTVRNFLEITAFDGRIRIGVRSCKSARNRALRHFLLRPFVEPIRRNVRQIWQISERRRQVWAYIVVTAFAKPRFATISDRGVAIILQFLRIKLDHPTTFADWAPRCPRVFGACMTPWEEIGHVTANGRDPIEKSGKNVRCQDIVCKSVNRSEK
jgi:hypothetical protein